MKKNKILAIVLSVATLSGVLSGCATTESVIDKMFKAMSKQTSQAADMNLGLKADFEMQGVSVAMDIGLEGSYAYQQVEGKRALFNFDGDLYLDMLDQSEEVDFELYMDLEDVDDDESEASIYIKSSEDDMWVKQVEIIEGTFFDGLNIKVLGM